MGVVSDNQGFVQLIPGSYKSNKTINITGIDEIHLKCNCNQGSLVNGVCDSILYSFAPSSSPGHQIYKELRIKLFEKINKPLLLNNTFDLEDDDHKPADFSGETISFVCQLIEIK